MVSSSVSCRAASYDVYNGHQNRLATRPDLIAAGDALGRACTDHVGLTTPTDVRRSTYCGDSDTTGSRRTSLGGDRLW
jgi:hypothetical protein